MPPKHENPSIIEMPSGTLSTLVRGLRILEYVVRAEKLVRLRDIAEEFGLDRSAALRFLRSLEVEGYISRHVAMKAYSIGPKLLSLPRLPGNVEQLIELARPTLVELARESGQMAHLGVLTGTKAVLVEVVGSGSRVAVKQAVGDLEPLYSSAVGKAIYAFLPDSERTAIGAQIDFITHTSRTLRDLSALEREAETIRRLGVAFDLGEGSDEVTCIGCPILGPAGYPCASIGISFVAAQLSEPVDRRVDDIARVKKGTRDIERRIFRS